MERFQNPEVEAVFNAYPGKLKKRLLRLRQLIFETAAGMEAVGSLEETLKWGQPSYLTAETKSGTTIRIDRIGAEGDQYGMFVHCQTSLMASYRELFPGKLRFEGKRCLKFSLDEEPSEDVLRQCIALALTYHLTKTPDRLPF